MLKNIFMSRDPELWKSLYTTYVKPHLEYAIQVWNTYTKNGRYNLKDIPTKSHLNPPPLEAPSVRYTCFPELVTVPYPDQTMKTNFSKTN